VAFPSIAKTLAGSDSNRRIRFAKPSARPSAVLAKRRNPRR
jgi:hypothetical protein